MDSARQSIHCECFLQSVTPYEHPSKWEDNDHKMQCRQYYSAQDGNTTRIWRCVVQHKGDSQHPLIVEHSNGMEARTTGAIALRPTGNSQGTHYFFSLSTARRVARNHWTELPMPQDVIMRVEQLSRQVGMDWADGLDIDPDAPLQGINGDEPWINDEGNIVSQEEPPPILEDIDMLGDDDAVDIAGVDLNEPWDDNAEPEDAPEEPPDEAVVEVGGGRA